MSAQSTSGHVSRCLAWAEANGKTSRVAEFSARLDGRQVSGFEACFVSGLELDTVGQGGDFLTLSQPFLVGRRPCEDELEDWMKQNGWEPWSPATDQATVAEYTWRRGDYAATDVVPRNAIVTEADERLRAIDFIVTQIDPTL